jgi:hypothetical protein
LTVLKNLSETILYCIMDEKELDKQKQQIIAFFDRQQDDNYWKTLDEISRETKIEATLISKIILRSGDFVRSSYRLRAGEPLFTTRKKFRDRAPFVDKVIGAFKNRID